jgi:hypothetical protein
LLQLFSAAADVLRRIGEDGRVIQEFIELGAKAEVAASEAMDTEATLGEIPDEFLDPIQVCLLIFALDFCHSFDNLMGNTRLSYQDLKCNCTCDPFFEPKPPTPPQPPLVDM